MFRILLKFIFRAANKFRILLRGRQFFGDIITLRLNRDVFTCVPEVELAPEYEFRDYNSSQFLEVSWLYFKSDLGFCDLDYWRENTIPFGHKLIIKKNTGAVVASCFAAQSPHSNNIGRFEWLVVDKSHRGKGLGKALAYQVTYVLAQTDLDILELNTFKKMKSALSIYAALGWKDESTLQSI